MTKVKVDTAQLVWKSSGFLESAWGDGQAAEKSDHSVNICQHSVPQGRPLWSSAPAGLSRYRGVSEAEEMYRLDLRGSWTSKQSSILADFLGLPGPCLYQPLPNALKQFSPKCFSTFGISVTSQESL